MDQQQQQQQRYSEQQQQLGQLQAMNLSRIDRLAQQLDQMSVDMLGQAEMDSDSQVASFQHNQQQSTAAHDSQDDTNVISAGQRQADCQSKQLTVTYTNEAPWDEQVQAEFEYLFRGIDPGVQLKPLPSFRRIQLDFSSVQLARLALANLETFRIGCITFKCYPLNPISAASGVTGGHLVVPQPKRVYLISPPASPPAGWAPKDEAAPTIDVQLISAISNLLPGQVHQIHPASESQPAIYVEVCEDRDNKSSDMDVGDDDDIGRRQAARIPKTMNPAASFHRYQQQSAT